MPPGQHVLGIRRLSLVATLAHTALNRSLTSGAARPADVLHCAQVLGVAGPVRLALDIASAR